MKICMLPLSAIDAEVDRLNFCKSKYEKQNCRDETVFTDTEVVTREDRGKHIHFSYLMTLKPSYSITSQPRMEVIDFITYVLGALGTWIGFSFIGLNPVGKIFTLRIDSVEPIEETTDIKSELAGIKSVIDCLNESIISNQVRINQNNVETNRRIDNVIQKFVTKQKYGF